jgi:hypothetical protein
MSPWTPAKVRKSQAAHGIGSVVAILVVMLLLGRL